MKLRSITVSIGSNIASRDAEVMRALVWLRQFMPASAETTPYTTVAEPIDKSNIPQSAPCCPTSAGSNEVPTYLNAVVRGRTPFPAELLATKFKAYERLRGRTDSHKAERKIIIDIDLVEFDGKILDRAEFDSPHFRQGVERLN